MVQPQHNSIDSSSGSVRDVVHEYLREQAGRYPDLSVEGPDCGGLSGRDAGLAGAINHAVMRRWLTLQAVLASRLNRSWESLQPEVRAALLAGAGQLLLLDRIPDHAALNEAVQWTKRAIPGGGGRKAGGLVNAVLRRVAELRREKVADFDPERRDEMPLSTGGAWRFTEEVFSQDRVRRLVEQTSHPRKLLERWIGMLGRAAAEELARHSLVPAPIVITGFGNHEDATPGKETLGCSPHEEDGFYVFEGSREELGLLLEQLPEVRVQDAGTAVPVQMTEMLEPKLIVDACAGRGTKTKQLAELHPAARIVATDKDEQRRAALEMAFAESEQVEVVDFNDLPNLAGRVDLLALDVPCTNTGVLARRVEAKYRQGEKFGSDLVGLQREITAGVRDLLAADGYVLYATCSIEPAENGGQAAWMREQWGWEVVEARMTMPRGEPGGAAAEYRDGGFGCLLRGG